MRARTPRSPYEGAPARAAPSSIRPDDSATYSFAVSGALGAAVSAGFDSTFASVVELSAGFASPPPLEGAASLDSTGGGFVE